MHRLIPSLFAIALLAAGCASSGGGRDDKALVMETLGVFKTGIESQDVAKIMESYSDTFMSPEGAAKADAEEFWSNANSQGWLDGAQVSLENVTVTVENDLAVAGPVSLQGPAGGFDLRINLKEEEGAWLIVSGDQW